MPQDNNKKIYTYSLIFALIFIIIAFLIEIVYKFKLLHKDIYTFMQNGGVVFSFVFGLLGIILLGTGIYYYYLYKRTKQFYDELEKDVNKINENTITWQYSDIDISEKIKNIEKNYKNKYLLLCILFFVCLIVYPESNIFKYESFKILVILYIIFYFLYLIIKRNRVRIVLKSPKEIVFSKEIIIFEDQTMLVNSLVSRLIKVKYDSVNNNLMFLFSYPSRGGNRISKVLIYVPSDKKEEVNIILNMYNR
ncbi:MAG: hypothetical protein PHD15_05435 [Clostridia bacterium]|nr:hypothetical protein [Clostridia bacterium]MDD4387175.1 hypothetical protein [Clostridia bacterium]